MRFVKPKKNVYQLDEAENTRHTQWNMFNDTGMLSRLHSTVMLVLFLVKSTVVRVSYQLHGMRTFQRHTAAATVYSLLYKTLQNCSVANTSARERVPFFWYT